MIWAKRMDSDSEFSNHWLFTVKTLFDIEDENKNTVLEKEEFFNFFRAYTSVTMPVRAMGDATSDEKMEKAWSASCSLSPNSGE